MPVVRPHKDFRYPSQRGAIAMTVRERIYVWYRKAIFWFTELHRYEISLTVKRVGPLREWGGLKAKDEEP